MSAHQVPLRVNNHMMQFTIGLICLCITYRPHISYNSVKSTQLLASIEQLFIDVYPSTHYMLICVRIVHEVLSKKC